MKHKLCIVVMYLILSPLYLKANIIYVPAGAESIQSGILASEHGDTVLVSPGRYFENINLLGKAITLCSNFLLTGDRAFIENTIIDGSMPVYPDTASVILMVNGEMETTIICGLTLTGGKGTAWLDEHGAGTFREGGGILMNGSNARICHNRIIGNRVENLSWVVSTGGGGIRCGDGRPEICNNLIAENFGCYGGGIVLNFSGADIHNNLILANESTDAYSGGAAIWSYGPFHDPKLITNNTITENTTPNLCPGIRVELGDATLSNNIIWNNHSESGQQVAGPLNGEIEYSYNIISGIDLNLNPRLAWVGDDSLGVLFGSPAIDGGEPDPEANDIDGSPNDIGYQGGPGGSIFPNPIGAYEFNSPNTAPYLVPGNDSLFVSAAIYNPAEKAILAEATYATPANNENGYQTLYDDASHGDSIAADGIYSTWLPAPEEETDFQMAVRVTTLDDGTHAYQKLADVYTTAGPIKFAGIQVHNDNPTFFPGAVIRFSPYLTNTGAATGVGNVTTIAEILQGGVLNILNASYGDISAGDTSLTENFSILVISPDSSIGSEVSIAFHISSQNHLFWSDTLHVELVSNPVSIQNSAEGLSPRNFELAAAYPNPFNPSTTIRYSLAENSRVTLTIFDGVGRTVSILKDAVQIPGVYSVKWNGTGFEGTPVATGVYFARLQVGEKSKVIKLVYLR